MLHAVSRHPLARPALLSRRLTGTPQTRPCCPRLAASKGFGTPEDSSTNQEANDKRSGTPSRKQQQQQQSSAATDSAPSTSAPVKPVAPQPQRSPPSSKPIASTPQVVVDRMFMRMVTCAALPVVLGIVLLVVFYFLKSAHKDDFPMWIVYVSQNLTFGGGLLGITYGIMSTSWDPNREGSVLGWDEFRANLPLVLNRQGQDKN